MTAAVVQAKEGSSASLVSSIATGNFTAGITAGSTILAFVGSVDGTHTAPTDTLLQTYTLIGRTAPDGSSDYLTVWGKENSAAGTNSVTANFSGAVNSPAVCGIEVGGVKTQGAVHAWAGRQVNAGDVGADIITSGFARAREAPGIIVALCWDTQGQIDAAGSGFTSILVGWSVAGAGTNIMRAAYKLLTAPGDYQATFEDQQFDINIALQVLLLEPSATGSANRSYRTTEFPKQMLRRST